MDEKNFVTAGPAADRTAGSQCQSEGADRKTARTPGPWSVSEIITPPLGTLKVSVGGPKGQRIARMTSLDENVRSANAARIVACVNACEGLSNEQVADFTRWAREYRIQRDELAAALRVAERCLATPRDARNKPSGTGELTTLTTIRTALAKVPS